MTTAATITARLVLDQSDYQAGLGLAKEQTKKFESTLRSVGSNLSTIGRDMSVALTAPIVLGATQAGQAFVDLDLQMRNIQSITGITDAEMQQLGGTFVEMSTDLDMTTDSAAKLAEGFYFISSAGFTGSDGMLVLEASTKAATAGLSDTMTAGQAITATLNAYGMSAEEAGYVSDVLFKTVDKGVLTFNDLASQLGDIVGTGGMANVGIDELGAALSVLTRKGISASESTTALNQLMLQFISPSKKQQEAAEEMGVQLDITTLRTMGLGGALEYIMEKGGGADALLTLFGDNVRALKAALALGGDGMDDFNNMFEEFQDVGGRTDEAFQVQTKSISAQLKNLKNELTALGLDMAAIFMPAIMEVKEALKPLIENFRALSPEAKKIIVIVLGIVAVIGPLLLIFGSLATAISAIIGLVSTIGLPVIGVILLIVAAVFLLYQAWVNNWGGIQEKAQAVWAILQPILESIWNAILLITTGELKGGIFGLSPSDPIILFLQQIHEGLMALPGVAQTAISSLTNIFVLGWTYLVMFASGQLGAFSVMFHNVLTFIGTYFKTVWDNILLVFRMFVAAFQGDWYTFGTLLRQLVDNIIGLFKSLGQLIVANLNTLWTQIKATARMLFDPAFWQQGGRNLVQGIINGIASMAQFLYNAITNIGKNALQVWNGFWGIKSPSTVMENRSTQIMQGGINGIIGMAPQFAYAMAQTASGGLSAFGTPLMNAGLVTGSPSMNLGTAAIGASNRSSTVSPVVNNTSITAGGTSGESKTVQITIQATVRSAEDVDYIAQEVAKRITKS